MRTLFLNPPSYDDFDGGAGSRYQAKREVWSFWYPTWLAYPAGMLPGARLLDAPPEDLSVEDVVRVARDYDHVVIHTSTPSFRADVRTAAGAEGVASPTPSSDSSAATSARAPRSRSASAARSTTSRARSSTSPSWPSPRAARSPTCRASASSATGRYVHTDEPAPLDSEQLDALPFATDIYARDLDYKKYNSPYCQYPYVSLYTGRGCPARCTFCLWPQVTTGHSYRTRSVANVLEECAHVKRLFPEMKELFFDDDTFTADPKRAVEIAKGLGKLGITWSTNSRANVDRETLQALEGRRAASLRRRLRVGQRADPASNIKKGVGVERARRFTRDCHDLGILIHGTFILGLPGRDARHHRGDDPLRGRDAARDAAGVARVAVSGHGDVRLGAGARLPDRRQPGRRDRLPEVHRVAIPRCRPTRSSAPSRRSIAATTSAVATSGSRSRRWRATARSAKRLLSERAAVPRRDVEAPPDRRRGGTLGPAPRAS